MGKHTVSTPRRQLKKPAWQNDADDLVMRTAAMRRQDEAFQNALRKAGVPEGVNTTASDGAARRYQPDRPDILKSGFNQ